MAEGGDIDWRDGEVNSDTGAEEGRITNNPIAKLKKGKDD